VGEGGNCLRFIHIEDGLLGEIVDLVSEMFPHGLPENSIMLLGSGTHLLRDDRSGYRSACVECYGKLARLGKSVQICLLSCSFRA
jgi:hypothetical protein